jgi:hypothetical protein
MNSACRPARTGFNCDGNDEGRRPKGDSSGDDELCHHIATQRIKFKVDAGGRCGQQARDLAPLTVADAAVISDRQAGARIGLAPCLPVRLFSKCCRSIAMRPILLKLPADDRNRHYVDIRFQNFRSHASRPPLVAF